MPERTYCKDTVVIAGVSGAHPGKIMLRIEEFGNPVITYAALSKTNARHLAQNILNLTVDWKEEEYGKKKRRKRRPKPTRSD